MTVRIILQRPDGSRIGEFMGQDHLSIAQMAQQHGINFPVACGIGMCWVCKCHIRAGAEFLQIDKKTLPLKPLTKDEQGQFQEIFACVWWIRTSALQDQEEHIVILEKHM